MEYNIRNLKNKSIGFWVYYISMMLVILCGIGLRFYFYIINRNLWVDEAALYANLIEPHSILNNAQYCQFAPPLFKLISLINIKLFSDSELILRFLPFVCGLLSIILFYFILQKVIKSRFAQVFAMALFAFNASLIYYSQEFKQYSGDVFVGLLFIFLVLNINFLKCKTRILLSTSFLFSLLIWLSHTSLLLLPGICIYFLIVTKFNWKKFSLFFLPIFISFILYYVLHLKIGLQLECMHNYWQFAFIKSFTSFFFLLGELIYAIYKTKYFILFILVFLFGLIKFFKVNKEQAILCILPIILVLTLSIFALYPMFLKFYLFTIPLMILVISKMLDDINLKNKKHFVICIILTLIFYNYFYQNILYSCSLIITNSQKSKIFLEAIQKNRTANDIMYLLPNAKHTFNYYSKRIHFDKNMPVIIPPDNNVGKMVQYLDVLTEKSQTYWLYPGFMPSQSYSALANWVENNADVLQLHENHKMYLFYIKRK